MLQVNRLMLFVVRVSSKFTAAQANAKLARFPISAFKRLFAVMFGVGKAIYVQLIRRSYGSVNAAGLGEQRWMLSSTSYLPGIL